MTFYRWTFYVEGKGWVAAGDLEIGDTLVTADGDEVEVADIEIEKLAEPITVYNLEVEDCHTYFVGEYRVLVHNSCDYRENYKQYTGKQPKGDVHHGFPKAERFRKIFESVGIDVHEGQYLFDIPSLRHTKRAGRGIHTNKSYAGKTWNRAWIEFFEIAEKNGIDLNKDILENQLEAFADLFMISRYRAVGK